MRFCPNCGHWTAYLICPQCDHETYPDPEETIERDTEVDSPIQPCPFCGAVGVLRGEQSKTLYGKSWTETTPAYWVTAMHKLDCPFGMVVWKSGGYFHPMFATKKEAIDNWNMRAGEKKDV